MPGKGWPNRPLHVFVFGGDDRRDEDLTKNSGSAKRMKMKTCGNELLRVGRTSKVEERHTEVHAASKDEVHAPSGN